MIKSLTIRQFFLIFCSFTLLTITACKKEPFKSNSGDTGTGSGPGTGTGNPGGGTPEGRVTAAGVPVGDAETKTIGIAGGSFTTSDGRISVEIPAGALNSDQTISIQPITNYISGAIGNAYRVSPGSITFNKPVKLTISFAHDDLSNTLPEATAIASQNSKGVWEVTGKEQIDLAQKTVTGYYSKFTDMAMFKRLVLVPGLAFVDPGKSIHLAVITTMELESDELNIPPVGPVKDSLAASIKSWSLAGAGSLSSNGSEANYTAPTEMPARNPVAVTATLNTKGTNVYKLVSNIYIGKEGITFRIDNGPWINGQSPIGATTQQGFTQVQGAPVVNGTPMGAVTLRWNGHTLSSQVPWTLTSPSFAYNDGTSSINYWQFYSTGSNMTPSPGGISFFWYGDIGEYITGIFILEKAGRSYPGAYGATFWDIHKIDGFFKVKRAN